MAEMARVARLSEILVDFQPMHSDLQIDAFITFRSGLTLYGCYKQAMREAKARIDAIRNQQQTIELLVAECKRLRIGDEEDQIREKYKRFQIEDAILMAEDLSRELKRFYVQLLAIRSGLTQQGIIFPLDEETRYHLDCDFWYHQIKAMAAVERNTTEGRISNTTLGLLQSLPFEMRNKLAKEIFHKNAPHHLMDWFMSLRIEFPEVQFISEEQIPEMVQCCVSLDLHKQLLSM